MPLAVLTAFESSQGLAGAVVLAVILLAMAFVLLLALRYVLRTREFYVA